MTPPPESRARTLERARLLDAEMQLQRAWLELSLRDMSGGGAHGSIWERLKPFKLGMIGLSLLKNRSLWLAGLSLLMNLYRRHATR
jgi:hypothetical protein